jgi:hypothetical protein
MGRTMTHEVDNEEFEREAARMNKLFNDFLLAPARIVAEPRLMACESEKAG